MSKQDLISPTGAARLVVTLPGKDSRFAKALKIHAGAAHTTLTDTQDAFTHVARRALNRLAIMVPFIDRAGATWALEIFNATAALQRILILRDSAQLANCGTTGARLRERVTDLYDYSFADDEQESLLGETFHAKIVAADSVSAYIGSANLLRRSRSANLECGLLVDGHAARAVSVLIDTTLSVAKSVLVSC